MSEPTLEARVAALEQTLAAVQQQLAALTTGAQPARKWWENPHPPLTDEQLKAFNEMVEYGRYYRVTGKDPPPDWNPGDPIPEVEVWGDDTPS